MFLCGGWGFVSVLFFSFFFFCVSRPLLVCPPPPPPPPLPPVSRARARSLALEHCVSNAILLAAATRKPAAVPPARPSASSRALPARHSGTERVLGVCHTGDPGGACATAAGPCHQVVSTSHHTSQRFPLPGRFLRAPCAHAGLRACGPLSFIIQYNTTSLHLR